MTRRIVVFAAFDKGGIVHNYVLTYLKKLKAVADKIIFIADNEASETERQKLNGLADIAVFKPHGEYDFGSYKRGIAIAKQHGFLDGADELILCNDSCFSVGVFKGAFDKMTAEPCDFWGMCESVEQSRHLQSFFLVFKRSVFKNAAFCDFFDAVRKQPDFSAVVQTYEIPLLEHFEQKGFKGNAFVPPFCRGNPTSFPLTLLKKGAFLIKRKVFAQQFYSRQSVRVTLKQIQSAVPSDYADILEYFGSGTAQKIWMPLMAGRIKQRLSGFFFSKKVRGGRIVFKLCKIPVWIKKTTKS